MYTNPRILIAYLDHFLPREIIGPVIIVFSLEGVIEGIFTHYVPDTYTLYGWALVFAISVIIVAYWGTIDEAAVAELHDEIEEIQADDADDERQ